MNPRLATAVSSYLKSAAHQPVDWLPWGPEAFARAEREGKPILLDIGAVWCHWCHVMDHESYEDPRVAELLNREFVCVKVDRDERPDVDARYQRAVQALTGQGGWPLTAFLTAAGEPFYAGTYFPPDDRHGRPGFKSVLASVARLYRERPDDVRAQTAEIMRHLRTAEPEASRGTAATSAGREPLDPGVLGRAADAMSRMFDFRYGGFGSQPKFPHPGACDFLLARSFDTRQRWPREIVERTLLAMAQGGIHDHVAGGFHRYSVDERWIVPHFEKMLYDNAELLRLYAHAMSVGPADRRTSGRPDGATEGRKDERTERKEDRSTEDGPDDTAALFRRTAEGVVEWVMTVMADPAGGYRASQDADVGPDDDGDFFTWTPDEVRSVTTAEEFEALARRYDIDDAGEMHHNPRKNVLWVRRSHREVAAGMRLNEEEVRRLLASGLVKLKDARGRREVPFVDPVIYTGWNALMASALLEAAPVLDRPDVEAHALRTLERLFGEAATPDLDRGLTHAIGSDVAGLLDDQVYVANAALDAFSASGDQRWLARAVTLMDHVWRDYRAEDGGLLDVARWRGDAGFLAQRMSPIQDSPTPSAVGVAGIALARLDGFTGEPRWRERLGELLAPLAATAAELSVFGATLLTALDWALMPVTHVVVVGGDDPAARALRRAARATYRPRRVVRFLAPGTAPPGLPPALQAMLDGRSPRAYVCAGTACAPPVETPEALGETLAEFGR